MRTLICLVAVVCVPGTAVAQARARAAREAAEALVERFGAKAGRGVPELAGQIERVAAKHGDEAILVIRRAGPEAAALVEAAGTDGAKALRVLSVHGEQAATRVLARPTAMKQFLQHGDEAAAGEGVVKPVGGGFFTLLNVVLIVAGVLLLAVIGLAYKHGPPKAGTIEALRSWFKK